MSRIITPLLAGAMLLSSGCVYRARPPQERFATGEPATRASRTPADGFEIVSTRETVGFSVEGRPIEAIVIGDAGASEKVLFVAGIHGDEPAGVSLMEHLALRLQEHPDGLLGMQVVIIPLANPDGMSHSQRANSRGVDLNRNFPALNREEGVAAYGEVALSEPESRTLLKLIEEHRPSRVISLHQPLACVDYDGPGALRWAQAFSGSSDLVVRKLGTRPGSLGAYAGETLQIPVITVELPGNGALANVDAWAAYGEAILAMINPRPAAAE